MRLHSIRNRVIDVVTAVITAQRENMTTSTTEEPEPAQSATASDAKTTKKAHAGALRGNVAPRKGKSSKKASPAKKAPKGATKATGARDGSKAAKILDLLKRPGGVAAKELLKATGWQPHSLRGFLSGIVSTKMGLTVTSTRAEDGERSYSIKT